MLTRSQTGTLKKKLFFDDLDKDKPSGQKAGDGEKKRGRPVGSKTSAEKLEAAKQKRMEKKLEQGKKGPVTPSSQKKTPAAGKGSGGASGSGKKAAAAASTPGGSDKKKKKKSPRKPRDFSEKLTPQEKLLKQYDGPFVRVEGDPGSPRWSGVVNSPLDGMRKPPSAARRRLPGVDDEDLQRRAAAAEFGPTSTLAGKYDAR